MIARGYVFAAVTSAVLGSLALLVAFPGAELLLEDGRVRGFFQDPNVFGPFLVPAALILIEELLVTARAARELADRRRSLWSALTLGVLFSFSRGAWLNLALGVVVMFVVLSLRRGGARRALAFLGVGLCVATLVGGAVVVSGSSDFLAERARPQSYDAERFGAQAVGINAAEQYPLGAGPGQFEQIAPISAHSTYVRVLAEQGLARARHAGRAVGLHARRGSSECAPRTRYVRHRLCRAARRLVRHPRQQLLRRHAALAASLARRGADLGRVDATADSRRESGVSSDAAYRSAAIEVARDAYGTRPSASDHDHPQRLGIDLLEQLVQLDGGLRCQAIEAGDDEHPVDPLGEQLAVDQVEQRWAVDEDVVVVAPAELVEERDQRPRGEEPNRTGARAFRSAARAALPVRTLPEPA